LSKEIFVVQKIEQSFRIFYCFQRVMPDEFFVENSIFGDGN